MKYNFDQIINRKDSFSMKWDAKKDVIPLWVADMDFHVAKEIEEALAKRVKHGVYGYSIMPEAYYNAEILWWKKRHQTLIEKEWILPTIGVIPALSSAVKALTNPGEKVIVLTPVYQYFYSSVRNNQAEVLDCPLINHQGIYTIDYALLESFAVQPKTKALILCNPHNPVGRVWTKAELEKVAKICVENDVVIIADEIHRDLTYERNYVPMQSISLASSHLITCSAPSKTFNVAGLKTANIVIMNQMLRDRVDRALNDKEVIEPSIFGIDGLIAAYNCGDEWLDQLKYYLQGNRDFAYKYINDYLPDAVVTPLEGTYLMWIDLKAYGIHSATLEKALIEKGVYINGGHHYGDANSFIRINLATSKLVLEEGLKIIINYLLNK